MKYGLIEATGDIRLLEGDFFTGLRPNANITQSATYILPPALPAETSMLQVDVAGNISYVSNTAGSVTSVALSAPAALFNVSGSPVTGEGTLSLTLANQASNKVLASPTTGSGVPVFRSLVLSDFETLPRLSDLAAPIADLSLNGQRLTNVANPINPQDAATKGYVDASRAGLKTKDSVKYATVANITSLLSANAATVTAALDPVGATAPTLAVDDRILVQAQTTGTENGIYTWNGTSLARSSDANTTALVQPGLYVFVERGDLYGDTGWVLTNDTVVLGTTALSFTQFAKAGEILDGNGLVKTGNRLDVGTASTSRIVVNANNIDLATTGAAAGTYSGITVDVYGRVTAAQASSFTQSFTNTSLSAGVITITHNLGEKFVTVQVSDNSDKVVIPDDITLLSTTQITLSLLSFGTLTGTWNVKISN